jgi:hypothetical protein
MFLTASVHFYLYIATSQIKKLRFCERGSFHGDSLKLSVLTQVVAIKGYSMENIILKIGHDLKEICPI